MIQYLSLRQKWSDLGLVFALNPEGTLKVQFPKGVITPALENEIRQHKPKIMTWLQEEKKIEDDQKKPLNNWDSSIIRSYPIPLHAFLTLLVAVRDGKYAALSLSLQELENFRHNMGWFFVSTEYYLEGWHPADVRTLWSDGWRAQDIIRFMASQKVKYILCHNAKIIQCLDLQNNVFVFDKATIRSPAMDIE